MSWQETNPKNEKLMFIADYLKREYSVAELCRRYQISRKTGHKLINRFSAEGEAAIHEKSRARHTHPNGTPEPIVEQLLAMKHRYPHFGPATIHAKLHIEHSDCAWPAISTIADIFKRHGLVKPRKLRKKVPAHTHPFIDCNQPNKVWSIDFKGHFKLQNDQYCYPLTITDNYSRFLLSCHGVARPTAKATKQIIERAFQEYGLPDAIKTDNGQPFAGLGLCGLTSLSIWWLKLGIWPERIDAGHPEQNGRHERMHRTLKAYTTRPPQACMKTQQQAFNEFIQIYNFERPHQGVNNQYPSQVYTPSVRSYPHILPEVTYPDAFEIRQVRSNGEIKWCGKQYFLSELLYREPIGLEPIDDGRAIVYFTKLKLGILDARLNKIIRF